MKKVLLVILAIAAIGLAIGFYLYNKKVPGLGSVEPDFSLTADELFDAFDADETSALAKYENKVLEVTGEVVSVKFDGTLANVILKAENAMAGGINCSFKQEAVNIEKGNIATIKGQCQGFLMDVVLNNCYAK